MSQPEAEYLRDILEAMEKAERYLDGVSFEEFAQDPEKQDAIEWNFTVMGEAAKQLTPELREENDDLPWRDMARMRDRIVHGYFSIDLEVLYKTVRERLPRAIPRLRQMLREIESKLTSERPDALPPVHAARGAVPPCGYRLNVRLAISGPFSYITMHRMFIEWGLRLLR